MANQISKPWQSFLQKISNPENDIEKLLQHFISKFNDYQFDYSFSPSKSKELLTIKTILNKIDNLELAKVFINNVMDKNGVDLDCLLNAAKELKKEREPTKKSGFKDNGELTAPWQKFKDKLSTYNEVPQANWKTEQLVGYTMKRYKDYMSSDYPLSYNGAPLKCKEMYCLNRACNMLSLTPKNMKDFIDWAFDSIIIPKKMIISSFGFFCADGLILAYQKEIQKNSKLSRTTQLPREYDQIIENYNSLDILTYGDLAFVKKAIETRDYDEVDDVYRKLFLELQLAGFDFEKLNELED